MESGEVQKATVAETVVEYRLGRKMVVFSPGYGVRDGSPGMQLFRDIISILPPGIGYALFSYTDEDDGKVLVKSTEEDAARLLNIFAWLRQQPDVEGVALVAHSRGCIDAAVAGMYPLDSAILLAPPLWSGHSRLYFTGKPGAAKHGEDWYVPRSDGTTSIMPERIFDEYEALDLNNVILSYAEHQSLRVLAAGDDKVLGNQDYSRLLSSPGINLVSIPGASHDFDGQSRSMLLKIMSDYISKDLLE